SDVMFGCGRSFSPIGGKVTSRAWRVSVVAVGCLAAAASRATTLYNNGSPNQFSGNGISDFLSAGDFVLTSLSTASALRFWDLEGVPADYLGSIDWFIYTDASGKPGVVLFSGSAVPVHSSTGLTGAGGFNEFQNDFGVGSLALAAGTYWLAL